MNRYSLKNEPEYDTPWIAAPNNAGDVGDLSDIVDELNKLKWERDLLALLASEKPEFFNPLHAARAVELRDKILQENSKDGVIKVRPDGRFEIIVEPRTSK